MIIKPELKNQIYFVIAAYNEETSITNVLDVLIGNGYNKIIVVDDKSKDNTVMVVQNYFNDKGKGILLKQDINQGQGAALRRGIDYVLTQSDCKYIVTFDADGQHRITDLPNFIEPLEKGECDIAIGSRFMNKETMALVPLKKKILLKGAVILTKLISKIKLTDTNNGYRVMNRYAANRLPINADKYEHASILIDDIATKRIRFKEVPTFVDYTDYSTQKGQPISNAFNILFKLIKYRKNKLKNRPSILLYNQHFSPLCNPPSKRLKGFADYFNEKDYKVRVVTGMPNYPTGKLLNGYTGLKSIYKKEIIDGTDVFRFFEVPTKSEGFIKRIINYLSFTCTSMFSFPLIAKSKIVFISTPPLFSAIPIYYISKLFGKKIILDVRDLWPESTIEVVGGKKGLAYNILFKIINHMYKTTDEITCVTHEMKKQIVSYGIDANKITVIYNFAKPQNIQQQTPIEKSEHLNLDSKQNSTSKIKLVYTGILTNVQGLDNYLSLNQWEEIRDKFEWHIAGDGEKYDELIEQCREFNNVTFYGYVSKQECNELIQSADLCIVPLCNQNLFKMALPSKMMEYSSYGKPILANQSNEVKQILADYDAGYFINNLNDDKQIPDVFSNAVVLSKLFNSINKDYLKIKSLNSIKMFNELFDQNKVCEELNKVVERVNQKIKGVKND